MEHKGGKDNFQSKLINYSISVAKDTSIVHGTLAKWSIRVVKTTSRVHMLIEALGW